jgi:hypothetical protein
MSGFSATAQVVVGVEWLSLVSPCDFSSIDHVFSLGKPPHYTTDTACAEINCKNEFNAGKTGNRE